MRQQRPGYFMQAGQHRIVPTAKSGAPALVDEKAGLAFSISQNVTISHGKAD